MGAFKLKKSQFPDVDHPEFTHFVYNLCKIWEEPEAYYNTAEAWHCLDHKITRSIDSKQAESLYEIFREEEDDCKENFNEENFLKLYPDFDLKYYKSKYNVLGFDLEVYRDYYYKGRFEKRTYNDDISFVFVVPFFFEGCGGAKAIHETAKRINDLKIEGVTAKLYAPCGLSYKNKYCNKFATFYDITENSIVVYPETQKNNFLNADNVVRWILLKLGVEMPIDHHATWNKGEVVYTWETDPEINQQLINVFKRPEIKNNHGERSFNLINIRKFSETKKKLTQPWYYTHEEDRIKIESELPPDDDGCPAIYASDFCLQAPSLLPKEPGAFSREWYLNKGIERFTNVELGEFKVLDNYDFLEGIEQLNKAKMMVTYDPYTFFNVMAPLCGCICVIHPIKGVSREEYFKSTMLYSGGVLFDSGMAYGNSKEEIERAYSTVDRAEEDFEKLLATYENNTRNFVENTIEHFKDQRCLKTVEDIYG